MKVILIKMRAWRVTLQNWYQWLILNYDATDAFSFFTRHSEL